MPHRAGMMNLSGCRLGWKRHGTITRVIKVGTSIRQAIGSGGREAVLVG